MAGWRRRCGLALFIAGLGAASPVLADDRPVVTVDRDDVVITTSCRVQCIDQPIADANGDGVVHIRGTDLHVTFETPLRGAAVGTAPDQFTGIGIAITGAGHTVERAAAHGFHVGILARDADRLVIDGGDVSDNFAQRLRSTPTEEATSDWLRPHHNDHAEWRTTYGAGLCIERSDHVTVRELLCRRTQNGIILDACDHATIEHNDCSFLSGWGLALWRSSHAIVARNGFDFCVRGYSHGVYNRGQDSAGILMFEQCHDNVFVRNSCTHGGDGVFAFAGRELLGEDGTPPHDDAWYRGRGNARCTFIGNDLSDAAAHGLESTFSFGGQIIDNRFARNAICGIWGGYSKSMLITGNTFEDNGDGAYGLERGGVNIEHGANHAILDNTFRGNACGVHLWWDDDAALLALPWVRLNGARSTNNTIAANRFDGDQVAVHLRASDDTIIDDNAYRGVTTELDADDASRAAVRAAPAGHLPALRGTRRAIDPALLDPALPDHLGRFAHLEGREHILMTEWGPYDHASPLLVRQQSTPLYDVWRVIGPGADTIAIDDIDADGAVRIQPGRDGAINVVPTMNHAIVPYSIAATLPDGTTLSGRGTTTRMRWAGMAFASPFDPRERPDDWRAHGGAYGYICHARDIAYDFGAGSPTDARVGGITPDMQLPADHFGMILESEVTLPAGALRVRTISDDGIRVLIDDEVIIDDWTWHAPKSNDAVVHSDTDRTVTIRVEYFELDGHAELRVWFEGVVE